MEYFSDIDIDIEIDIDIDTDYALRNSGKS